MARFRIKTRRLVVLLCLLCVFLYLKIVTRIESSKIYEPLPKIAALAPDQLDHSQLLIDVKTLSSPEYDGRRTGTPGSKKAQEYILKRFQGLNLQPLRGSFQQKFSFVHHSIQGLFRPSKQFKREFPDATNLMGYVKGTKQPSRFVVISAHYDHLGVKNQVLFPGADDNASGVAAVLACAKYFSDHYPNHSILFVMFDAEEFRFKGAEAFFRDLPLQKQQIALDINLDMVSHNSKNEIFVAGTYHYPFLKAHLIKIRSMSKVNLLFGHDRPMHRAGFVEDWTDSSDHTPFHENGIPFLYFGVEDHEDYHRPSDTFEHINQEFFVRTSEMILQTALLLDQGMNGKGSS